MTQVVRAEGAGSIAVGRDAINSIFVTGGVNQFFVGQYERLADAYLSTSSLYRELALDDFVGRDWLVRELDRFVAERDRGYLVVEAEAGMGKTAFMAWLARERRYVHHFVRLMPDPDDIGVALRSLAAQLIRAWDVQELAVGGVLPPNASRPDFFEDLLEAVARRRDATKPGEPIVVTVDGLNETTPRTGQNPLALPADVPPGVYFVVSQRTVHVPFVTVAPRGVAGIRADSTENLDDMRAFLRRVSSRPDLQGRLREAGLATDAFVERLVDRSSGVWLVIRYVLAELRGGSRRADELESLPAGLWQYYATFWRSWQQQHGDDWATVDLPLLVTLTAAQEPATVEFLCALAGIADVDRAYELLGDPWRPFLRVSEDAEERYSAFHASLSEFVAGEVDATTLASAERSFVRRLGEAHRAAHRRIAERYLSAWGGLDAGLPALREDGTAMDGGYGMRQLVSHLVRAGDDDVLHRLLALEWEKRNVWYEPHRRAHAFAAYAVDVERAWARARANDSLPLSFRYALMASSVNSVAGNVPADLLRLLVERSRLSPGEAAALAHDVPDARARAEALIGLAPLVPATERDDLLRNALASVQAVPDGYWRAGELARLIAVLGPEHADDVHLVAEGIRDEQLRETLLWLQARHLGSAAEPPAWTDPTSPDPLRFLDQYRQRTGHLATLLDPGRLTPPVGVKDLLTYTEFLVRDPRARAEVLTASYDIVSPEQQDDLLRAALDISMLVEDQQAGAAAFVGVSTALASLGHWTEARDVVALVTDGELRSQALFTLAQTAPAEERAEVVTRALTALSAISNPSSRARMLLRHAPALRAMGIVPQIEGVDERWRPTVAVATGEVLDAAAVDRATGDLEPDALAWFLTYAVPHLPIEAAGSVAAAVESLEDDELRERVKAALGDDRIGDGYWRMQAKIATAAAQVEAPTWRAHALASSGDVAAAVRIAETQTDPATQAAVWLRLPAGVAGRDALDEARRAAAAVEDPGVRPRLDIAVATAFAEAGRVAEALAVAGSLDTTVRGVALLAVAPWVGTADLEAALAVAATIGDLALRAQFLAQLTPAVIASGSGWAQGHVHEILRLLAQGTRRELLEAMTRLLPAVDAIAGPQALKDMTESMTAAYRWWP